jgi:DNA-binding NtrC family response regulator
VSQNGNNASHVRVVDAGAQQASQELGVTHPPSTGEVMELAGVHARSASMRQSLTILKRLAQTDMTITLTGETGSGKDVLAQAVHRASPRAKESFVVLDCGAVVPNLAEAELLGQDRAAGNGAVAQYIGAFERAHGGTLFIDEVGELSLELQTRLLRIVESRRVRRVGGSQDRAVDVRLVAATNRELSLDVAAGRFRQDLYFRLAAAVVRVPPVRERREDLPLLVPQLLADLGRPEVTVTREVLDWTETRTWPGNVRELKNALAFALAFVDDGVLEVRHFAALPPNESDETNWVKRLPLAGVRLSSLEQAAIAQTLAQSGGNKMQAARILGIAVSTLYEKLKRYDIT